MQIFKDSVGIDVSKSTFYVCHKRKALEAGTQGFQELFSREKEFKNTAKGIESFIGWLSEELDPSVTHHIAIVEATNVYHQALSDELYLNGFRVCVANPRRLKHLLMSYAGKGKTDPLDSQKIARAGLDRDEWQLWEPSCPKKLALRTLSREASSLQSEISRRKCRIDSLKHAHLKMPSTIKRLESSIKFLQKQRDKVLKQMRKLVESIEDFREGFQRVQSIPGVGELTALCVISETNGFAHIHNQKQLCSFAGYDVVQNQSGKFHGRTKISKRGNVHLRKAMYMPALSALRYFPAMRRLYDRVAERSGIGGKGRVAVQRKLLCLIYTLWKSGEEFDMKKYEQACNLQAQSKAEQKQLSLDANTA